MNYEPSLTVSSSMQDVSLSLATIYQDASMRYSMSHHIIMIHQSKQRSVSRLAVAQISGVKSPRCHFLGFSLRFAIFFL